MDYDYYDKSRGMQLARAYVPFQRLNQVYDTKEALMKGTLFPELYMPYKKGKKGLNGGRYYD